MNTQGNDTPALDPAAIELEALEGLAQQAKLEAEALQAAPGSQLAKKAACLEWLAATAAYSAALRGPIGTMLPSVRTEQAERAVATQFASLLQEQQDA